MFLFLLFFLLCNLVKVLDEETLTHNHQAKWAHGFEDTASKNLVTAIYLDYRLFDTFLEASVLFIAVGGIIFMSKRDQDVT